MSYKSGRNLKMSSGNRRPPVKRKPQRRRIPGPFLAIIIIVLIVLAILFITRFIRNNEPESTPDTSAPESSDVLSSGVDADADSSNPDANSTNNQPAENYDDLTPATERDISSASKDMLNTMFIVGDSGYRYYTFRETQAIQYIEAIKTASERLSDKNIYEIIVPTSTDIMLPQSFLADVSTSDQEKAIDYFNASINTVAPSVKTIDLYDILKANCDKDIYFRTDRSWTQLGAYYAYRVFAQSKDITALPLTDFTQKAFDGFTGSIYTQSDSRSELSTPETVVTYTPQGNYSVTNINSSSESSEGDLIADVSESSASDKYNAFLGGNYPYSLITNHNFEGESACLLIKDSMGNAFAPFLAPHYKYVYVVDYRSWTGTASNLATEKNIDDIIIMTQIEFTSDYDDLSSFSDIF